MILRQAQDRFLRQAQDEREFERLPRLAAGARMPSARAIEAQDHARAEAAKRGSHALHEATVRMLWRQQGRSPC
jgi:hypothetical protein